MAKEFQARDVTASAQAPHVFEELEGCVGLMLSFEAADSLGHSFQLSQSGKGVLRKANPIVLGSLPRSCE